MLWNGPSGCTGRTGCGLYCTQRTRMQPFGCGPLRVRCVDRMLQADFLRPDAMPIYLEQTLFLLMSRFIKMKDVLVAGTFCVLSGNWEVEILEHSSRNSVTPNDLPHRGLERHLKRRYPRPCASGVTPESLLNAPVKEVWKLQFRQWRTLLNLICHASAASRFPFSDRNEPLIVLPILFNSWNPEGTYLISNHFKIIQN